MPNVRSKNKARLGVWIDSGLKKRLDEYCKAKDMTATDAAAEALEQMLTELEKTFHEREKTRKGK